jgi:hypothetical protein
MDPADRDLDNPPRTAGLLRAVRRPWAQPFPEVVLLAEERRVKQHHHYAAAKAGDPESAARLVQELAGPAEVAAVRHLVGGRAALLASVHAQEEMGVNAIP